MKTIIYRIFSVLVLAFLLLSAGAQSNDDLKSKIEQMNKEMAKAMVDGNVQAAAKFYANDAISMPNGGEMVKGIDAIKKSNQDMMSQGMKFKSAEFNTIQVNSYGNMVSEIGTYKMKMSMPGAPNDMEDAGKYLTLWEKQPDGTLKIKVETWNTNTNPMMQGGMGNDK